MTLGGWIIMLTSVSVVTGWLVWCILRVLRIPEPHQHLPGPDD